MSFNKEHYKQPWKKEKKNLVSFIWLPPPTSTYIITWWKIWINQGSVFKMNVDIFILFSIVYPSKPCFTSVPFLLSHSPLHSLAHLSTCINSYGEIFQWPFNENVAVAVMSGEVLLPRPSTVSMTLEISQTWLHALWQLLNDSFSSPLERCVLFL